MLMSEYNYEQDIEVQREEAYEEGKKYGLTEGKKLGIAVGEERYSKLLIKLSEEGKLEQISKVAKDAEFREHLYREYGI